MEDCQETSTAGAPFKESPQIPRDWTASAAAFCSKP